MKNVAKVDEPAFMDSRDPRIAFLNFLSDRTKWSVPRTSDSGFFEHIANELMEALKGVRGKF
jgi:hypothetical protein